MDLSAAGNVAAPAGPARVPNLVQDRLGTRQLLATGGMARVYSLPDLMLPEHPYARWVYKKYKTSAGSVSVFALQRLVDFLANLDPAQRVVFERVTNWPTRVVVDGRHGASGVVLPELDNGFFFDLTVSSGAVKRKPLEAQFLLQDAAYCRRVGVPELDRPVRLALCRSLAYAMAVLDKSDLVYGDLSARNFLIRLTPKPVVKMVDCDAIRMSGSASAVGRQPHSPDWEPPEAIRARQRKDSVQYSIQSRATDRYKLGLAILRLLTPGPGCGSRVNPEPARAALGPRLYPLLQRSLTGNPLERPSAKEWHEEMLR